MPRPEKFSIEKILKAAARIAADDGPNAATITAIAAAIGAPSGSIYHRFRTRDELLGRLWLSKAAFFQDSFAKALRDPDPHQAALQAALSLPRSVRADFTGARIMLLHRREDFLGEGWPRDMKGEATRLGEQARTLLAECSQRLYGSNTKASRLKTSFAVLDVPFAAVRRYVSANKIPPPEVDSLIEVAVTAILSEQGTEPVRN